MIRSANNINGIIGILAKARQINPNVGTYIEHFENEKFEYAVRLSNNGRVVIPFNWALDFERMPDYITDGQIKKIADQVLYPQMSLNDQVQQEPPRETSFWKKLFKIFTR